MATRTLAEGTAAGSGGRRLRRLSNVLIAVGVGVILYAGVILAWGDPVTWLWAHWQQRALTHQFHQEQQQFARQPAPPNDAAALAAVRADALAFKRTLKEGHA